ncbi:MAG: helix-turn-helix domain-containing protein [Armatimonadota bacterium]|nr:helix-turn-helix domain-containing protein [Armatimonadota bacterium]
MTRALTVEQAAEYLQLSPYTVRQWLRSGKIPGRKIGRVYRILESDLEALVGAVPVESTERQKTKAADLLGKYKRPGRTVEDFVREKAAEVEYLESKGETETPKKPRKLAGRGSLAHVGELSSEAYLKLKQEERERENQRCDTGTRAERVQAVRGMFAGSKRSVDDFLRDKQEEIETEERRRR